MTKSTLKTPIAIALTTAFISSCGVLESVDDHGPQRYPARSTSSVPTIDANQCSEACENAKYQEQRTARPAGREIIIQHVPGAEEFNGDVISGAHKTYPPQQQTNQPIQQYPDSYDTHPEFNIAEQQPNIARNRAHQASQSIPQNPCAREVSNKPSIRISPEKANCTFSHGVVVIRNTDTKTPLVTGRKLTPTFCGTHIYNSDDQNSQIKSMTYDNGVCEVETAQYLYRYKEDKPFLSPLRELVPEGFREAGVPELSEKLPPSHGTIIKVPAKEPAW